MTEATQTRECEDCGEPIGARRLRALPHTRMCIECAEDAESDARHSHDSEAAVGRDEHHQRHMAEALRDLTES